MTLALREALIVLVIVCFAGAFLHSVSLGSLDFVETVAALAVLALVLLAVVTPRRR